MDEEDEEEEAGFPQDKLLALWAVLITLFLSKGNLSAPLNSALALCLGSLTE